MSIRDRLNSRLPRGYFADAQDHHFTSPSMGNSVTGTGEPRAAEDTERTEEASLAGDSLPVGMDTRQALGLIEEASARVTASAVPSAAGDCPDQYFRERAELPSAGTTASSRPALDHSQLHAARLLRL